MKLLVFTDIHGSPAALRKLDEKIKLNKPELLVCAGDISIFEQNISGIIKELDKLGKTLIIIPGNHESEDGMKRLCDRSKYLKYIHKSVYVYDNYCFIGYGGGGFSLKDSEFKEFSKKAEKKIPKGSKVILVLHGPPHGTKVDHIYGSHAGNKDYSDFIKRIDIELVVCGHLHENSGKEDMIGKTRIINPGPYGKIINL